MPIEQTHIAPGSILEGKVQGITKFGAFIELPGGIVGLVHISEIADTYVKDVRDFLQENDPVKVKVLSVAGKKIALSVKQAMSSPPKPVVAEPVRTSSGYNSANQSQHQQSNVSRKNNPGVQNLDDMIVKFLKESDERMQPLKNKIEHRRRNRSF